MKSGPLVKCIALRSCESAQVECNFEMPGFEGDALSLGAIRKESLEQIVCPSSEGGDVYIRPEPHICMCIQTRCTYAMQSLCGREISKYTVIHSVTSIGTFLAVTTQPPRLPMNSARLSFADVCMDHPNDAPVAMNEDMCYGVSRTEAPRSFWRHSAGALAIVQMAMEMAAWQAQMSMQRRCSLEQRRSNSMGGTCTCLRGGGTE